MRAMNENTRKLDVRIPMTANIASMPTMTIFVGFMFSQYEKGGSVARVRVEALIMIVCMTLIFGRLLQN